MRIGGRYSNFPLLRAAKTSPFLQVEAMERKVTAKKVSFDEVSCVWNSMVETYGMVEMVQKSVMGHECVRETLYGLRVLWIDNDENLSLVSSTIQVITVLSNMTGFAQMDGGRTPRKESVWVEAEPFPSGLPLPMRRKLAGFVTVQDKYEHWKSMLHESLKELSTLIQDAGSSNLALRFRHVQILLDDADLMLTALWLEKTIQYSSEKNVQL